MRHAVMCTPEKTAILAGKGDGMSRYFRLNAIAVAVPLVLAGLSPSAAGALQQAAVRAPTPSQPAVMAVQWAEVREDARTESAVRQRRQTAPEDLTQPRNMDVAAMGEMEVPVLVPANDALALGETPTVLIFPRRDYYTLSVLGEGIVVEVFCTRIAHTQAMNASAERMLRGTGPEGYRSERTEYGRELSFNRYGVAYSITIECEDPNGDPRCIRPEYGRQLMQSLQVLPGSRGAEGGR